MGSESEHTRDNDFCNVDNFQTVDNNVRILKLPSSAVAASHHADCVFFFTTH